MNIDDNKLLNYLATKELSSKYVETKKIIKEKLDDSVLDTGELQEIKDKFIKESGLKDVNKATSIFYDKMACLGLKKGELENSENLKGLNFEFVETENGKKALVVDKNIDGDNDYKTSATPEDSAKIIEVKNKDFYNSKFGNYNRIPETEWKPDLVASASDRQSLKKIAEEISKKFNVPEAFLLASFAIETHPQDYDVADRKNGTNAVKTEKGVLYAKDPNNNSWVKVDEMNKDNYFPYSGWLIGGLDNESWIKGAGFVKNKDYVINEGINEKYESIKTPMFRKGSDIVKAQMIAFGKEVAKYYDMAQKENWKNFDNDAPYVLARIAYNAGSNSKAVKQAMEHYKNGNPDNTLPRTYSSQINKNLEHALKVLYSMEEKGIGSERPIKTVQAENKSEEIKLESIKPKEIKFEPVEIEMKLKPIKIEIKIEPSKLDELNYKKNY